MQNVSVSVSVSVNKVSQEIKRGDIWLAELEGSKGSEMKMVRPVVIIQNNLGNKYSPCCTIIPLTSKVGKRWMPTHTTLHKTVCLSTLSIALAEQVATISKERLTKFIGVVEKSEIVAIEDAIMIQLGIKPRNNIAYAN